MPLEPTKKPVQTLAFKPIVEKQVPSATQLAQTFSTEQLPSMDSNEGGLAQANEEGVVIDANAKIPTEVKKQELSIAPAKEAAKVVDDKTAVKEDNKESRAPTKEESNGLPSFLKPPKSAEDKAKEAIAPTAKKEVIAKGKEEGKDTFDYSGFSASEVTNLKNMSRQSREFTSSLIKENKELAKLKDGTYLQHPQAYVLSPEFNNMNMEYNQVNQEYQHWRQQLALSKEGKKVRDITGWSKDGKLVVGEEVEPNENIEEQLRMQMHRSLSMADGMRSKITDYPNRYKTQITNDMQGIQQERRNRFAWVADPKILDYSVELAGKGEVTLKKMKDDFLAVWPPYLREDAGVQTSADMFLAMVLQGKELEELKASKQVAETKLDEASLVEPSSRIKPGGEIKTINGVKEFSMQGMPE